MHRFLPLLAAFISLALAPPGVATTNIELIIDASGSMSAKMAGRTKMDIAKEVFSELVRDLPSDAKVALRAYGHRSKTECSDIELLAGFDATDRNALATKVQSLKPLGKTPIAQALELAGADFKSSGDARNIIILVSDGEETCKGDPCAVAKKLRESGIGLQTNVVGFNVAGNERKQLECIAMAGGGKYYDAGDASALAAAATQVQAQVAQATPPPTPTPDPRINLLAQTAGGQLLVAPSDKWTSANDGKEEDAHLYHWGEEGVFAFKDEQPATFDTFAVLIPSASERNIKDFELLVGDDGPTGEFRSIGKFTVQNAKMMKSPYQEFKFPEVTAKYFKVKLINSYSGEERTIIYEFKLFGKPAAETSGAFSAAAKPKTDAINLLAPENGGQLLAAPNDNWKKANDGKEEDAHLFTFNQEGIFAFKDEQPATFDTFATLVPGAAERNIKEFELLVGDEGPTGEFRSIGKFTVQNARMIKSPYQEFKFPEVTAKYLKVKLLNSLSGEERTIIYEFRLMGKLAQK